MLPAWQGAFFIFGVLGFSKEYVGLPPKPA